MMLLRYLFWNTSGKAQASLLARAVRCYEIDVLVLAEAGDRIVDLLEAVNRGLAQKYSIPFGFGDRLTFLTRLPDGRVEAVADSLHLSIRHVRPVVGYPILLVGAHLPSKLHRTDDDLAQLCTDLIRHVERAEAAVGHTRTVIIGDFNMNPFEKGVVGAAGFHATSVRNIAEGGQRIVDGTDRRFFYNPMWSFFGDRRTGPSGTYYYARGGQIVYYWNIFDQVLLRPSLLSAFSTDAVQILAEIDGVHLLSTRGTPEQHISDHLPILLTLDHSEEITP